MLFFIGQPTADDTQTLFTRFTFGPFSLSRGKFTVGFTACRWLQVQTVLTGDPLALPTLLPPPWARSSNWCYAPSSRTLRVLSVPPRASNFSVLVAACRTIQGKPWPAAVTVPQSPAHTCHPLPAPPACTVQAQSWLPDLSTNVQTPCMLLTDPYMNEGLVLAGTKGTYPFYIHMAKKVQAKPGLPDPSLYSHPPHIHGSADCILLPGQELQIRKQRKTINLICSTD